MKSIPEFPAERGGKVSTHHLPSAPGWTACVCGSAADGGGEFSSNSGYSWKPLGLRWRIARSGIWTSDKKQGLQRNKKGATFTSTITNTLSSSDGHFQVSLLKNGRNPFSDVVEGSASLPFKCLGAISLADLFLGFIAILVPTRWPWSSNTSYCLVRLLCRLSLHLQCFSDFTDKV